MRIFIKKKLFLSPILGLLDLTSKINLLGTFSDSPLVIDLNIKMDYVSIEDPVKGYFIFKTIRKELRQNIMSIKKMT